MQRNGVAVGQESSWLGLLHTEIPIVRLKTNHLVCNDFRIAGQTQITGMQITASKYANWFSIRLISFLLSKE